MQIIAPVNLAHDFYDAFGDDENAIEADLVTRHHGDARDADDMPLDAFAFMELRSSNDQ